MRSSSIALTLSLISYIVQAQQSPLMETLSCCNDYESYTACTWSEHQDARNLVKMNLFYKDMQNLTQMTCSSQEADSQIHWSCHRNQTIFNVWAEDTFIFKPDQELKVQKNVSLFDNVQPPPPQFLDISVTEGGDFLLAWKADDGTNKSHWLDGALDFEVTYKRHWESWEDSASLSVSKTSSCLLRQDDLIPGSTYVARVRSKLRQNNGLAGRYSKWSYVVHWETQKTWKDDQEAQPKNLCCLFNGIDQLKCSWEVRQEVTSSVLFALFYKASPEAEEKKCSPVLQVSFTPYVLQSCEINVTNPMRISQYLVTVRPKEEDKKVKPSQHIKPDPPLKLSVIMLNNQEYSLQWEVRNRIVSINKMYQISYWKTGKPLEAQYVNSTDQHFTFTSQYLEPDTSYTAKVRTKVHFSVYAGPWSEWSKEFSWATDWVMTLWSILLITSISIILMMADIYFCRKYLLRKKTNWEESIPHPPGMFLLPSFFQKVQLPNGSSSQSSLEDVISSPNIAERQMLVSQLEPLEAGLGKIKPHSVAFQHMKEAEIPAANPSQFLNLAIVGDIPACSHNPQIFDFDGPYLLPLSECQSEIQQDLEVVPLETKATPTSLQYVGLPECLRFQQLPVGKEKEAVLSLPRLLDQGEEKQLLLKKQKRTPSQLANVKLEKEENEGKMSPNLTSTKNLCQNVPLDYIATEHLSLIKERDSLLLTPVLALKEGRLTCPEMATAASQLTQPSEDLSNSEWGQKEKADSGLPTKGQTPAFHLGASQDAFGNYVLTLLGTLKSVPKEQLALSTAETKHGKGFFILNSGGNSSPVFLCQVDEYCFFPGSKPTMEAPKSQGGSVAQQLSEASQKGAQPPCENKFVGNKPQNTPPLCQDLRADVPHLHA